MEEWKNRGRSTLRFFGQRRAILNNPRIVQEANPSAIQGWKSPLAFAAHGLLFTSIVVSIAGFAAKNFLGLPGPQRDLFFSPQALDSRYQMTIQALKQAQELAPNETVTLQRSGELRQFGREQIVEELTSQKRSIERTRVLNEIFNWMVTYLQPILVTLGAILSSYFFRKHISKSLSISRYRDYGDRFYLYIYTSRLFWANVMLSVAFVTGQGLFTVVGVIVGFIGIYRASKDLYAAFDVPEPKSYWTRANKTFGALAIANIKGFFTIIAGTAILGATLYGILVAVG